MLIGVAGSLLQTAIARAHVTLVGERRVVELLDIGALRRTFLVVLLHALLLHLDVVGKAGLRPALHLLLHLAQAESIHRTGVEVDHSFDWWSPLLYRFVSRWWHLRSVHVLRRHGGA